MGSRVSRPTGRTSFSVISANARAALRWRSTLSENESVVNAVSGGPEKKLVFVRSESAVSILTNVFRVKISRTFKELQKVRHGLPFVFQQQRLIRLGLIGPDWKQRETLNMGVSGE